MSNKPVTDILVELKDRIKELEQRIEDTAETLHAIANEQRHREHGCEYAEVSSEDLQEIIDGLNYDFSTRKVK